MKAFYFVLFLTLTITYSVDAQQNEELKTFTNYGSCHQGLKTKYGKEIWPADFESLRKVWNFEYRVYPRKYNWIAEKNGSFGFINSSGELILPFVYSKIQVVPEGIIASDDSSVYFFLHDFQLIFKLKDYS